MVEKSFVSDTVTVQLNIEEAITSDTVKATLAVSKVISDDQPFDLRALLRSIVDVNWEIHKVQRYEDNGLQRVAANVSARIADSDAALLHKKVADLSKAGLKIQVLALDYSPERNKIEAAKQSLRQRVYKLAHEEAEILNQAIPQAVYPWRVGSIDFARGNDGQNVLRSATYATVATAATVDPEGGEAEPIDVAYKVGITATVRLTRSVVV